MNGAAATARGESTGEPAVRDRVRLTGLTARGRHGVFDVEREQGQTFVVDVDCALDLSTAASTDDLSDTVDYGRLAAAIAADIEGEPLKLLEALADRVARTCLQAAAVTTVEVTVHKPEAPMPVHVEDVAVTLVRRRP